MKLSRINREHDLNVLKPELKHSYVNKLYMKSGALWLYILTGLLSYAHKIPYIGRIFTILGGIYGRTTIWKLLVKIRRIFTH